MYAGTNKSGNTITKTNININTNLGGPEDLPGVHAEPLLLQTSTSDHLGGSLRSS